MNKILEETLAQQKPDPAFEQRMLTAFRQRIPERGGLVKLLADLMRLRAAQVAAVAAALLGLVQLGRMITGESAIAPTARDRYANEPLVEQPPRFAVSLESGRTGALNRADERAAGEPKDLAPAAPPASAGTASQLQRETKPFGTTVAPVKTAQAEMPVKETGSEEAMNYAAE